MEVFGEFSPLLIIAMIAGLVEFSKKLGVNGKASLGLSMGLGVGLTFVFQLRQLYPVIDPWFTYAVYGVLGGLTTSGLYDLGKRYSNGA